MVMDSGGKSPIPASTTKQSKNFLCRLTGLQSVVQLVSCFVNRGVAQDVPVGGRISPLSLTHWKQQNSEIHMTPMTTARNPTGYRHFDWLAILWMYLFFR